MNDPQFRALLDLLMCCDPFPVVEPIGDDSVEATIKRFADEQSKLRGFNSWIVAYHEFKILGIF